MKALFVIAGLAATLLSGCTVYDPAPRVAYVTPGTAYVAPTYVSPYTGAVIVR